MSKPFSTREERKKAKQADRRRRHVDKYEQKASGAKAQTKPEANDDGR